VSKGIGHGTLNPFTYENVYRLSWQQLQDEVQGVIQLCFYEPLPDTISSPIEYRFKITGIQVLRSSQNIPLLEKKGYLFSIDQNNMTSKKENPANSPALAIAPTGIQITAAQSEVDLHIEKLIPEHSTLNAAEMLRLQLDTFEKHLDLAIAHGRAEIIFIHGIGNGILKSELHTRLGRNKQVASFSDARKEKFGYGATLVSLK
ncbi:MAG: mismatch repair protein MutS, partial [Chitinophagaceae bacterium]|nr:mismatch repair protein MutS [Chitinophagaceae bacterium]